MSLAIQTLQNTSNKFFTTVKNYFLHTIATSIQKFKQEQLNHYLVLYISPQEISYHAIKNEKIYEEHVFKTTDIKKIPTHIQHLFDLPIHIVFGGWELKTRAINLTKIDFINRYYLKKEFKKGQFETKDIIKSSYASYNKDFYHFTAITQNYTLDDILLTLTAIKNPLIKCSIEEELLIEYLNKQTTYEKKDWSIFFKKDDKEWHIIVSHKNDLILSRNGISPENMNHISRYFVQEILDTIRFLPKFGLNKSDKITIFFQKDIFKIDDFDQKDLSLNPYHKIEQQDLFKPQLETFQEKITRWKSLNFFKKNLYFSHFFWHRILYLFPRYTLQFCLPVILFSLLGSIIYSAKIYHYHQQKQLITKNYAVFENEHDPLKKAEYLKAFDVFKGYHQKNPILIIRHIAEGLQTMVSANTIEWENKNDQIKIILMIDKKNIKGKKNMNYIKKVIEKNIEKKINKTKISWTDNHPQHLILTLTNTSK